MDQRAQINVDAEWMHVNHEMPPSGQMVICADCKQPEEIAVHCNGEWLVLDMQENTCKASTKKYILWRPIDEEAVVMSDLLDCDKYDNLYTLQSKVRMWAEDRGIFQHSDAKTQCLKTVSEVGELADSVAKGSDVRDDIGDILVTLILLAQMKDTNLEECLKVAYSEIAGRVGRMHNGTFVKDVE